MQQRRGYYIQPPNTVVVANHMGCNDQGLCSIRSRAKMGTKNKLIRDPRPTQPKRGLKTLSKKVILLRM